MDDFVTLTALEEDNGKRIDVFLSERLEISRSAAAKLIESGNVESNMKAIAKNLKIKENEIFEVTLPEPVPSEAIPQNIPLEIIYEDKVYAKTKMRKENIFKRIYNWLF